MRLFRTIAMAVLAAAMTSPATADPLTGAEIRKYIAGEWDYTIAPDFEPDAGFCTANRIRITIEGETFQMRHFKADRPDDFFWTDTGRVTADKESTVEVLIAFKPQTTLLTVKIEMPDRNSIHLAAPRPPAEHGYVRPNDKGMLH